MLPNFRVVKLQRNEKNCKYAWRGTDHLPLYINIIPLCCIPETNVMSWLNTWQKAHEEMRVTELRTLGYWHDWGSLLLTGARLWYVSSGSGMAGFLKTRPHNFVEWVSTSWWGLIPCSWSWPCRPQSHYRPCNWWIVIPSLEGWRLQDSKTVDPDYTPGTQHRALKGRSFIHGWKTWIKLSH